MRILMWLTIGFGAACGLCAYLLPAHWILPVVLAVLSLSLLCFWKKRWYVVAAVGFGCAGGLLWFLCFQWYYLLPVSPLDGQTQNLCIIAADYDYDAAYGVVVDGRVALEGKSYQISVYLQKEISVAPGDEIHGPFYLRVTAPAGETSFTYHQGKGIFLLAYQDGPVTILHSGEPSLRDYPAILRADIQRTLRRILPEDVFPFAQALLLGDASELDYETDTALKISGIRHVIAVSGMHVSILFGLVSTVAMKRRYFTALLGIPVLLLFAAVAGFTPSVNRACIMSGLLVLAQSFQKEYDPPTSLSFACLVMFFVNPLVITSVSFQLSVSCVAGILLFNEPIRDWLLNRFGKTKGRSWKNKLRSGIATMISVSLSAMVVTTPLSAMYFGTVSLIGVVTNLLTLWLIQSVFIGLILICVISLISMKAAVAMGIVLAWPIRCVLAVAKLLANVPMAAVYTQSVWIVLWLILSYVLLALLLLKKCRLRSCVGIVSMGLCLALLISWLVPQLYHGCVTVMDVGQGQSILLQSQGRTYLVDCGGDGETETADIVSQTLLSQGIRHLDGIIITHPDRDHACALENLLTRIDTDLLLISPMTDAGLQKRLQATGTEVIPVSRDLEITFGDAQLRIFAPIFVKDSNENSLCVLFNTKKCDILITGDRSEFGERMLLRDGCLPDVDVLIAGHHGAEGSTCTQLLQAVTPETVIISVGSGNAYGHPAPELLERLKEFGCTVRRTDEDGTIYYGR